MRICGLLSIALLCGVGSAQTPPDNSPSQTAAVLTFTRMWQNAQPRFFKIEISSTGDSVYTSKDGTEEPYVRNFKLSEPARQHIFDLAQKANYFNGNFDYAAHKVAFTGTKSLAYRDSAHTGSATFNWSRNPVIEQLNDIFDAISNTVEAGRRLDYLIAHDKLGINQELAAIESQARSRQMQQLQILSEPLRQIASDPAYMHIAQQKARDILQIAETEAQHGSKP